MNIEVLEELKNQIIYRLDESTRMNTKSLSLISEDDVWKRVNNTSNSIGNLILHLCGNITQYAISSLGNTDDLRNRDLEFSIDKGYSKSELLEKLNTTLKEAKEIINKTTLEEYLRKREVQGFTFSGIGIVIHVTEHYSYHTGQIAFWVKQLKNKDLGFYDGVDLTIKNKD
ncbi:DinB family protein [Tenacibaculum sp. 190524A05c]|uniref:Damage-inducible protein DinB n=1 Tax=Tenacibaculum platacis TaxID=3137852 RepID=A0ABM9P097_9FLAO